jgi:hypothetical protein
MRAAEDWKKETDAPGGPAINTLDLSNRSVSLGELQRLPETLTCLDLSRCGLESLHPLR